MAISIISRQIIKCFSFLASVLHAVSGVMSLALCLQVVSQALQHFLRGKLLVMVNLSTSLRTWSFPFTPACPWQSIHKFWRWLLNTDACQSGLPITLFIASTPNLGIRNMGYTRRSIEYSTILKVIKKRFWCSFQLIYLALTVTVVPAGRFNLCSIPCLSWWPCVVDRILKSDY